MVKEGVMVEEGRDYKGIAVKVLIGIVVLALLYFAGSFIFGEKINSNDKFQDCVDLCSLEDVDSFCNSVNEVKFGSEIGEFAKTVFGDKINDKGVAQITCNEFMGFSPVMPPECVDISC